jgi:two-component system response regulator FixJ
MSDMSVVYLIDDDASFLRALTRLLCAEGFRVCSFVSASEFLLKVSADMRGCIVADLEMPDIDGLQLQSMLQRAGATMPLIFLTGHGSIPCTVRAMRSGAVDFLEKSTAKERIMRAISCALERDAAGYLERARLYEIGRRFSRLTNREREVLQQVVCGKMNKQIAAMLGIHERTVRLHRTAITTKVGEHSVARLATLAHEISVFNHDVLRFAKR